MAVSSDSCIAIAHHSKSDPVGAKILCINLSGQYVCEKYPDIVSQVNIAINVCLYSDCKIFVPTCSIYRFCHIRIMCLQTR